MAKEVIEIKVLFTFYIPSGGVETLNRQRCKVLMQDGIECHLLYYQQGTGMQNLNGDIPVFMTSSEEEIRMLVITNRYDAIIVSSDYPMLARLRMLGYQGILIYESQGFGSHEEAAWVVADAVPYLQRYANAVLLPNTTHLVQLFTNTCPWLNRYVFPNVLDTSVFNYVPNTPPTNPVIAWVGRLEPNKNWRHFIDISYWMLQNRADLRIWMFYDDTLSQPEDKIQFEKMLTQLGMSSVIERFQSVPHAQMPLYYSMIGDSGGYLLSTSLVEGFGYAVAEAMACRCPVLSSDSDGVRAFIDHNETGKFYQQGDILQAILQGLDLMNNVPQRESIRRKGLERIVSLLAPDKYVRSFRQMMNTLGVR
ncbi:glycosyltransferase family 4 protein [Paenibacillus peoriae]|uniref:glycosyltransferase family 4 protein n=1 Tax=Paenibacillus TaxID=44249 RepID=UPI0013EA9803|nr:glycosyltransferase family 4 protein [Paenibacillus sp. EKM212P]KAF6577404.1 glycosyltransferase family 4 protein [Paenibacillus sp. EKM212P]